MNHRRGVLARPVKPRRRDLLALEADYLRDEGSAG
jgi:hypothetical protein